jgi:DNA uptake protein ComE-like DNA-binding protein
MGKIVVCTGLILGLAAGSAAAQESKERQAPDKKTASSHAAKGRLKLVDLNTATEAELRQIPGVDKAIAKKIIDNRPYVTVEDLARSGIPVEVRESAAMRVTVTPRSAKDAKGTADRGQSGADAGAKQKSTKK